MAMAGLIAAAGCTATVAGTGTALPTGAPASNQPTSSLSASQLAQRAHDELAKATSVHISGDITDDGVRMQLEMTTSTSGAEGTVTMMDAEIQIKLIGSALYLKAPASFWQQHAGMSSTQATYLASKWLQTTPTDDFASLQQFATPAEFAAQLFSDVDLSSLTTADSRTIDSRPAVGLKDPDDDSLLYVATTGDPDPLALVAGSGGESSGEMLFTDYGKSVQITAPSPDETLSVPNTVAHI